MNPDPTTFHVRGDNVPSIPPNVTWPMVWYRIAKDMPHSLTISSGTLVAITIIVRIPEAVWASVASAVLPIVLSIIGRSRPDPGQ